MNVPALYCDKCHDTIFSRARHDFRSCTCGNISIDGGFDYARISFKTKNYSHMLIKVHATIEELYEDWNTGTNKYGLIKAKGRKNGTDRRKA